MFLLPKGERRINNYLLLRCSMVVLRRALPLTKKNDNRLWQTSRTPDRNPFFGQRSTKHHITNSLAHYLLQITQYQQNDKQIFNKKKLMNSAKVFLPNERTFFISFTLSFLASRTPLMCDAVPGRSHCPSEQRASRRVVFHTAETRHTRPQDTVLEALWNIFIIQLLACSFNGACRGRVVVFYNCGWLFHLFIRFSLLRFNCIGKWRLAGRKVFIRKRRKGGKHKIRKLRV